MKRRRLGLELQGHCACCALTVFRNQHLSFAAHVFKAFTQFGVDFRLFVCAFSTKETNLPLD
jgi:hypothetical protein